MSTLVTRIGLRALAWKHPEKRADIRKIRRDSELLEGLTVQAAWVAANEYGLGSDRPFLDFLDWFIEHADEIFAIITKLLLIFAEGE